MRKIDLYIENEELFSQFITDSKPFEKIEDNHYTLEFDDDLVDTLNTDLILLNLAMYLLLNYTEKHFIAYKSEIIGELLEKAYYRISLFLELDRFLRRNEIFKESVFMTFNVKGLKEDIEEIIENIKIRERTDEVYKDIGTQLKNVGMSIKYYKSVKIDYINGEIAIIPQKHPESFLTPSNISDQIPLVIDFDVFQEQDLIDLSFCSLLIMILKIEKIEISRKYEDLYENLLEQIEINGVTCEVKIVE